MDGQILSWVIGAIGILGFYLAGKKVWWSWYINLGCQTLWFAYAIVTSTPAFAITALFYTYIFSINAYRWTIEHISKKKEAIGNLSEN